MSAKLPEWVDKINHMEVPALSEEEAFAAMAEALGREPTEREFTTVWVDISNDAADHVANELLEEVGHALAEEAARLVKEAAK